MMDASQVREMLKAKAESLVGGQVQAARDAHVGYDHFNAIVNGRRPLGKRVLKWLGLRRVLAYEEIPE